MSSQYQGMKHTAEKLARQEHSIRTDLNSLTVLGNVVHCPACKTCNIDIVDLDEYSEIMRCKCKECGQFFIENLE